MEPQRRRQAKKLIEAARWWAGVREEAAPDFTPDLSIVEAMEAMCAPAEDVEAVRAQVLAEAPPEEPEGFGVYADNLTTVSAFLALRTQWNYAGMAGQRTGFNYAGVSAWLQAHIKPRRRRALFSDLQVMEHAVLQADHEQRKNNEE